jgi:hypothetical protein
LFLSRLIINRVTTQNSGNRQNRKTIANFFDKADIYVFLENISMEFLGLVDDIDIIGNKYPVASDLKHLFSAVHVSNQNVFPYGMDTNL